MYSIIENDVYSRVTGISVTRLASMRNFTVFFKSPVQMPEQYLTKMFRVGTGLISDAQRASVEVNGAKLTELNDG